MGSTQKVEQSSYLTDMSCQKMHMVTVCSVRSLFCFAVLFVLYSFAIISLGKRELVALLLLCSECHVPIFILRFLSHDAMGWSVVCDCDISWLYPLSVGSAVAQW